MRRGWELALGKGWGERRAGPMLGRQEDRSWPWRGVGRMERWPRGGEAEGQGAAGAGARLVSGVSGPLDVGQGCPQGCRQCLEHREWGFAWCT